MGKQNVITDYQNSIYLFHDKEEVLTEIQRSAENTFHATRQALMVDFIWCPGSAQKIY